MCYFHSQLYQDSWMIWPDQFVYFQLLIYLIEFLSLYISCTLFYFHLLLDQIVMKCFSFFQSYLSLFVWFIQWLIYHRHMLNIVLNVLICYLSVWNIINDCAKQGCWQWVTLFYSCQYFKLFCIIFLYFNWNIVSCNVFAISLINLLVIS